MTPPLTRELRITCFEGVPTKIYLKQHADKTEYLVMFHGREESVKSTNVARNKRMPTDFSPKLEHAAWQNGARLPFSHRTRPPRALTPRKVDSTRPSDRRWAPAGFSQGPAYKSRPGLFTRQGQIEVFGLRQADRQADRQTCRGPSHTILWC